MSKLIAKTITELAIIPTADLWLVDGIIPAGVLAVAGNPKTKKTFWCLSLCLSLATQKPFLGKWSVPRAKRVLYIAGEGDSVIGDRLRGLASGLGIMEGDLHNLFVVTDQQLSLTNKADRQRLREIILETKVEVICLDPWSRFIQGASESSTEQMAEILGFLKSLQNEFGVSWLIAHHLRKTTRSKPTGTDLRGSNQLHSWVDCTVILHHQNESIAMDIESRHGEGLEDVPLELYGTSVRGQRMCVIDTGAANTTKKRIFRCKLISVHGKPVA